jgi:hypothetical protein
VARYGSQRALARRAATLIATLLALSLTACQPAGLRAGPAGGSAGASAASPRALREHTASPCLPADTVGEAFLHGTRLLASASDSGAILTRRGAGIPEVTPGEVSLVTDARICQRAVDAYRSSVTADANRLSHRAYVVAVGRSAYVVWDPAYYYRWPGQATTMVFDSRWARLGVY